MRLNRRSRLATALLALISVLFMQLAVAAYACPAMQIAQTAAPHAIAADLDEAMGHCQGMMPEEDEHALCYSTSQIGDQSLNKPAFELPPAVAIVLVPAISGTDPAWQTLTASVPHAWLTPGIAPPLSIRNCCFRI